MSNKTLQNKLIEKLTKAKDNKEKLNSILMDLIKSAPKETTATTTDFARATLLLGWDKTKTLFDMFWKYIMLVKFKQPLESKPYPNSSLNNKIANTKKDVQLHITNLVRFYLQGKFCKKPWVSYSSSESKKSFKFLFLLFIF